MPAAVTYTGSIAEMGIGAGSSDFFAIPSTLSGCQTDIYAAGQNKYTVGDSSGLQYIPGTLDLYALGVNPLNIYLDDSLNGTRWTATITASTITAWRRGTSGMRMMARPNFSMSSAGRAVTHSTSRV